MPSRTRALTFLSSHRLVPLVLALLLPASSLPAADKTWDGGGADDNWQTDLNWTDNVRPAAGDRLFFAGSTRLTPNNDFPAGTSFDSITFSAGGFTLSGNAVTLTGAIDNATGSNTIQLPLGFAATRTITVAPGLTLTISGSITGAGGITKNGTGILVISGTNSFAGPVTIDAGTIRLSTVPLLYQYYRFNPTAVKSGTAIQLSEVQFFSGDTWTAATTVTYPAGGFPGAEGPGNTNDNITTTKLYSTIIGPIVFDFGAQTSFDEYNWATANDSPTTRDPISWTVDGSNDATNWTNLHTVTGYATTDTRYAWVAPGASRYNGWTIGSKQQIPDGTAITINGAVLDLNGVSISTGAIALTGSSSITGAGTLTLGGSVTSTGTPTISSNLALAANTIFDVGATSLTVAGSVSGAFGVTKNGTGTMTYSGSFANTYTGTTTLNSGTLTLNKAAGVNAFAGPLVIGNGTSAATVQLGASNQIPDTVTITMNQNSNLNLVTFDEAVGRLTLNGGIVDSGTGLLTLKRDPVVNVAGATEPTIAGRLTASRVFAPSTSSLLAHWKLDETTAGPVVDQTGTYPGTNVGALINQPGVDGTAYQFNGSSQYVNASTLPLANQSFSISAWAKRTTTTNDDFIVCQGTATNYNGLHFGFRSGNTFTLAFWGNDLNVSNYTEDNGWNHWVGTYDATTRQQCIYRNGVLLGYQTSSSDYVYNGTNPLYIGRRFDAPPNTNYFNGLLDDVRVYLRMLTPAEIGGGLTFTTPDNGAFPALTVSAAIEGSIHVVKNGPGILRFSGSSANTYSGTTRVQAGTLLLNKSAAPALVPGAVLYERWDGITGTAVSALTGIPSYPYAPNSAAYYTTFEGPVNTADNYGTRMRGFFIPNATGKWWFSIATDDNSELWLSPDENASRKQLVAYIPGSTGSRSWNGPIQGRTDAFNLVAGQRYYIEAIHKEGTGNDNIAVRAQQAVNFTNGAAPIDASMLAAIPTNYAVSSGATLQLAANNQVHDAASVTVLSGGTFAVGTCTDTLDAVVLGDGSNVSGSGTLTLQGGVTYNGTTTGAAIACNLSLQNAPTYPPTLVPIPLVHWKLDDGSGNTALDSSPNGKNGTITGTPVWMSGPVGGALDSTGCTITAPANTLASLTDKVTIAFWLQGGQSLPYNTTFLWAAQGADRTINIHLPWGDNNLYFDCGNSGGTFDRINKAMAADEREGRWHHWVFVKDATAGTMQIYMDGSLWHSGTGKNLTMNGAAITTIQLSQSWAGVIDDFRIYGSVLSPADIAALASVPLAGRTITVANGAANPDLVISGALSGTNTLTKEGAGTLQLTAASAAFTGQTLISAGTLTDSGGTGTLPNSAIAVQTDGTLAGTSTSLGPVTLQGGTLSPGDSGTPATLGCKGLTAAAPSGDVLLEYWTYMDGSIATLTGSPRYPSYPTGTDTRTSLEAFRDWVDNYGVRMSGWFKAPVTGDHYFAISNDDPGELWFCKYPNIGPSHPSFAANFSMIASCTGAVGFREFNRTDHPEQRSAAIPLVAGQWYFIRAFQKEGGGGDHVSVTYSLNGTFTNGQAPIPGSQLSRWPRPTYAIDWTSPGDQINVTGGVTLGGNVDLQVTSGIPSSGETRTVIANDLLDAVAGTFPNLPEGAEYVTGGGQHLRVSYVGGTGNDVVLTCITPGPGYPPVLLDAYTTSGFPTTVNVLFNRPLNAASAGTASNYAISATNPPAGTILRDYWTGIPGSTVAAIPVASPPTGSGALSTLEYYDFGIDYGMRIRGYFVAPGPGTLTYYFAIASEDDSELWLDTTKTGTMVKIASVTGWTNIREWNKYPSQRWTTGIALAAGEKIRLDVLHKSDDAGFDHLSVSVRSVNADFVDYVDGPIPGSQLAPVVNVPVLAATLQSDGRTVTLTTGSLVGGLVYTLIATNVEDTYGNLGGGTDTFTYNDTGRISREYWSNIGGGDVVNLTSNASYPDNPSGGNLPTLFEAPTGWADNYGTRMRGYFIPNATGNWYFTISSDDDSELWLSTNASDAHGLLKTLIARIDGTQGRWSNDTAGGRRSASIALTAGSRYYIEALQKEGGGGDYLAVAAKLVSSGDFVASDPPIPGSMLAPYLVPISITSHPASQSVQAGDAASFAVSALGSAPRTYQWQKETAPGSGVWTNITVATSQTFGIGYVTLPDAGDYRVVVSNPLGSMTSDPATLTVVADTTPPRLVSVTAAGDPRTIVVVFNELIQPVTGSYAIVPSPGISSVTPRYRGALRGHWRLDEADADTVAVDASGSGLTGTYVGTLPPDQDPDHSPLQPWNAYSHLFNGIDQAVTINDPTYALKLTRYSLSAWFKTSGSSANQRVITSRNVSSTDRTWWLSVWPTGTSPHTAGAVVFKTSSGGAAVDISSGTVNYADGLWHHVVAVLDGTSQARLYVDGVLRSSQSGPGVPHTPDVNPVIGNDPSGASRFFPGYLDDVRVFDYGLTLEDVSLLYNTGRDNLDLTNTVVITTSSDLLPDPQQYTLTATGVLDVYGNTPAASTSLPFRYYPTGNIYYERWDGIGGTALTDLTNNANYPYSPSSGGLRTSFDSPVNWADNYGLRFRGWYIPPSMGYWWFCIASDDNSSLLLNPAGDSPTGAVQIASANVNGRWDNNAPRRSNAYYLERGKRYYVEAFVKEGGGGDYLAVAAKVTADAVTPPTFVNPDDTPIPGTNLCPWMEPLVILAQTPDTALQVGDSIILSATVAGSMPRTYQWQKYDGAAWNDIPGATARTRTIDGLTMASSGQYRIVVNNPVGSTTGLPITLTVLDSTAPTITAVVAPDTTHVVVYFTEEMDTATAQTAGNYLIGAGTPAVTTAVLSGDKKSVTLTLLVPPGPALIPATTYQLTVSNVQDANNNLMPVTYRFFRYYPDRDTTLVTTYDPNTICREWWLGIDGTGVGNLTGDAKYPDEVDGGELATRFEGPTDWSDNFGTRFRGYFYPNATRLYFFAIASDDNSELWLSANPDDATGANKVRIARVPDWTTSRDWSKFAEQRSAPILLVGGRRYYIEAYQKEGGGGDNVAVGVKTVPFTVADNGSRVIPGNQLSPYLTPVAVVLDPLSLTVDEGDPASLSVRVSGSAPRTYVWQKEISGTWTDLPIAAPNDPHTATYSFQATVLTDEGNYRVGVKNSHPSTDGVPSAEIVYSNPATLTITPSTAPPRLVSVTASGINTVVLLTFNKAVSAAPATETGSPVNLSNYSIQEYDSGLLQATFAPTGAVLLSDLRTVRLTVPALSAVDWSNLLLNQYVLTVQNVEDRMLPPNPILSPGDAMQLKYFPPGLIAREWWSGIGGSETGYLTGSLNYPYNATSGGTLLTFEGVPSTASPLPQPAPVAPPGDNYGQRFRGYYLPPTTDYHHFAAATDDDSDLYFNPSATEGDRPVAVNRIAFLTGAVGVREYNNGGQPNQRTQLPIHLTATKRYYIEALQKEGGGGDHIAVAVRENATTQQERWDRTPFVNASAACSTRNVPTAGATAMTWYTSTGDTDRLLHAIAAFAPASPGSIAFVEANKSSNVAESATSLSTLHTLASGSNRMLIVGVTAEPDEAIGTVEIDFDITPGTDWRPLTLVPGSQVQVAGGARAELWYLPNASLPAGGSSYYIRATVAYRASGGDLQVTTGNTTVTSTGVDFAAAGVVAGHHLRITEAPCAGDYLISSVSGTSLVLALAPTNSGTDLDFQIVQNPVTLILGALSLTGVAQQPPEAVATNSINVDASTITTSITTLTNGAWVVDVVHAGNICSFTPQIFSNGDAPIPGAQLSPFIEAPRVLSHPADRVAAAGGAALFNVVARGTSVQKTYQWQKYDPLAVPSLAWPNLADGGNISGAQTYRLSITSISDSDRGYYRVVVVNAAGMATSNPALLDLSTPPTTTDYRWISGGDASWTNNANWDPDLPTALVDQKKARLVFLEGSSKTVNFNSVADVICHSIRIEGTGYAITPSVGSGNLILFGSVGVDNAVGTNTLTVPLRLAFASEIQMAAGTGLTLGAFNLGIGRLTVDTATGSQCTIGGAITNLGSVRKNGPGTLTLGAANAYAGVTVVNEGTIVVGANGACGTGLLTLEDGITLRASGAFAIGNSVQFRGNATLGGGIILAGRIPLSFDTTLTVGTADSATLGGVVSGVTILTKAGAGSLALAGNNTLLGNTVVAAGTLVLACASPSAGRGAVADASRVSITGGTGTYLVVNQSETLGGLDSVDGSTLTINAGKVLALDTPTSTTSTITGAIDGKVTSAFRKIGDGTATLNGTGPYVFGHLQMGAKIDPPAPITGSDLQTWAGGPNVYATASSPFAGAQLGDTLEITSGADIGFYAITEILTSSWVELSSLMTASATGISYRFTPSGGTWTSPPSGTFNAGTANIKVQGYFAQATGTFTSTSGLMQINGSFLQPPAGGTGYFLPNNGTVMMSGAAGTYTLTPPYKSGNSASKFHHLVINDGLAGYWKLDETTAGATAVDASGFGHAGTPVNGPVPSTDTPATVTPTNLVQFTDPASLYFDGSNDYVEIADSQPLDPTAGITVSVWVKADDWNSNRTILQKGTSTLQYRLWVNGSGQLEFAAGGVAATAWTTVPSTGVWHHIVGRYDGSYVYLYLDTTDGFEVSLTAAPIKDTPLAVSTEPLRIGTSAAAAGATHFKGLIDEVRIYTRALTDDITGEIYALATGKQPSAASFASTKATYNVNSSELILGGDLVLNAGKLQFGSATEVDLAGSWLNHGGQIGTTGIYPWVYCIGTGANNKILSGGQAIPYLFIGDGLSGGGTYTLADQPIFNSMAIAHGTLSTAGLNIPITILTTGPIDLGGSFDAALDLVGPVTFSLAYSQTLTVHSQGRLNARASGTGTTWPTINCTTGGSGNRMMINVDGGILDVTKLNLAHVNTDGLYIMPLTPKGNILNLRGIRFEYGTNDGSFITCASPGLDLNCPGCYFGPAGNADVDAPLYNVSVVDGIASGDGIHLYFDYLRIDPVQAFGSDLTVNGTSATTPTVGGTVLSNIDAGEYLRITSGSQTGYYLVSSRTDAHTLVLATSLSAQSGLSFQAGPSTTSPGAGESYDHDHDNSNPHPASPTISSYVHWLSLDNTAAFAIVNDGLGADIDYQASTTSLSANWSGFGDHEAYVDHYEWRIRQGTPASPGAIVQNFTSVYLARTATATGLSLTAGSSYFVTVLAVFADATTALKDSDGLTVGALDVVLTLGSGYNLIALPVTPMTPYTAQTLIASMNAAGLGVTRILDFNGSGYDVYTSGGVGTNFNIVVGKGYFVRCAGGPWTVNGIPLSAPSAQLSLGLGYNLIGLPRIPSTPYNAQAVLAEIGGAATRILDFNGSGYDVYTSGGVGTNFPVVGGKGYFIRCSAATTWTLSRP